MIDAMTVAHELEQARACRMAAEAACSDVEELLGEMQRSPMIWQRLTMAEGCDELRLIVETPMVAAAVPQPMALAA